MISSFRSISPVTGEVFASFATLDSDSLDAKLTAAAAAQKQWSASSIQTRSTVLRALAAALLCARDELGRLATLEMGKTYVSAMAEADKSAATCEWYAEHGPHILEDKAVHMPTGSARIVILPLGVILAIMPWNFPIWQAIRFIAPALMAGNGVLLKHAANVPQCALAIERVIHAAGAASGMPVGLFTTLFIEHDAIGGVIKDDRVSAVTLTGSERAGSAVAQQAGRALKKCVLELGGSDPFIVMPSADVIQAVSVGIAARMNNNGQSCVCAKRFIVHSKVYDEFKQEFVAAARALPMGDPMLPATSIGPLCTLSARDALHNQVERAVKAGARILTGGVLPDGPGAFYAPTVLVDVPPGAPIAQEEFFGPVAMLFKVSNAEEALQLANAIPFGLGSSVWTRNQDEIDFFVQGIHAGMTAVNTMIYSDPRVPFGGVKRSGYGRELAEFGMLEFCNVKTVLQA